MVSGRHGRPSCRRKGGALRSDDVVEPVFAAQLIRLRQRERWTNQVHVAIAVQLRVSSKVVKLRRFLKEGFHLSRGLEGYKDLSWIFANVRPDVWHLSWGKQRITRLQPHPILADLEDVLALHHIEPLFLSMVKMAWWTPFTHADLLEKEQTTTGVLRGDFIRDNIGAGDCPWCVQPIQAVLNSNAVA